MTKEEASKLNCPLKPAKETLDGRISYNKCVPTGCMCWVEKFVEDHTEIEHVKDIEDVPKNARILGREVREYGELYYAYTFMYLKEKSYCTLRGKDKKANVND